LVKNTIKAPIQNISTSQHLQNETYLWKNLSFTLGMKEYTKLKHGCPLSNTTSPRPLLLQDGANNSSSTKFLLRTVSIASRNTTHRMLQHYTPCCVHKFNANPTTSMCQLFAASPI